jgi:hypothetical protein
VTTHEAVIESAVDPVFRARASRSGPKDRAGEEFAEDLQVSFQFLGVSEVRALLEYNPLRSAAAVVDRARDELRRVEDDESSAERILLAEPTRGISVDRIRNAPVGANDDHGGSVRGSIPNMQGEGAARPGRVDGHLDYSTPKPRR